MTGQVKEEILTRLGELGFRVVDGCARLDPGLLDTDELLPSGPDGPHPARFSVCAVPQTVAIGPVDSVAVTMSDGTVERRAGLALTRERSRDVFGRTGAINRVEWTVASLD
jgi:hypothetical protein